MQTQGMISLKADFDGLLQGTELVQQQIPFAIARTLTLCAQAGQAAGRAEETSGIFKIRNDWTVRNTKITPATKQTLQSEVYTDTSNRITGAPDYLVGQEDGRERVPIHGRQHIAIPTKLLYELAGGPNKPIPDWLRPANLLNLVKVKGQTYVNRRGKSVRSNAQTRGYYFFKVTLKSGGEAILCRALNDPPNAALPLYLFVTSAHIRKRLHLAEDVDKAVQDSLEGSWDKAWKEVFINDGLRASGIQLKF